MSRVLVVTTTYLEAENIEEALRRLRDVVPEADVLVQIDADLSHDAAALPSLLRVRDFPADGERLVADRPAGMSHVLLGRTPIRIDGEPVEEALAARPAKAIRG